MFKYAFICIIEDLKKKEVTVALIKPDVVEEGKVDQIIEDVRNIDLHLHYRIYN